MANSTTSLIRGETELNTLRPASEARSIAETALAIHEQEAVARVINNAVNTGNYSCKLNRPLSDTMKSTLIDQGYTVSQDRGADPRLGWTISW